MSALPQCLMRIWVALVVVLFLTGCARSVTEQDAYEPPAEPARAEVPWENYDGSVKTRIDEMDAANDCVGLQSEFDIAYANDDAARERTGTGNAMLMSYIDEALQESGCY